MTVSTEPSTEPESRRDDLSRETRASAALLLLVMSVVLTISLVGLAIT
jgi:hypothetical protein